MAFGVGSDVQGGVADILGGGGGGTTGAPDVGNARDRVRENPKDPDALRDLATALQQNGETEAAIDPLTRYTRMRPRDEEALRELAGLHLGKASRLQEEAALLQQELQQLTPGTTFQLPSTSPLGQALGQPPIQSAVAEEANQRFSAAYARMQDAYGDAKATYARLAKLVPDDASIQLQLAETAQNAGDVQTAVTAYARYLKLAPDDPNAPIVREQLKQLRAAAACPCVAAAAGV